MKAILISLIGLVLLFPSNLLAQNTQSGIEKSFAFEPGSRPSSFTINIMEGAEMLHFMLESTISQGNLQVRLMDPEGEKQGGFQLIAIKGDPTNETVYVTQDSQKNSKDHGYTFVSDGSSDTKGNMLKTIPNPQNGKWVVIIMPQDVKGKMSLSIQMSSSN